MDSVREVVFNVYPHNGPMTYLEEIEEATIVRMHTDWETCPYAKLEHKVACAFSKKIVYAAWEEHTHD